MVVSEPSYHGKPRSDYEGPAVVVEKLTGVWSRRVPGGIEIILPDRVKDWILSTHLAGEVSASAFPFSYGGEFYSVDLLRSFYVPANEISNY
jgi:hypothetical protein